MSHVHRCITFTPDELIALSLIIHACLDEMAPQVAQMDEDQRIFYKAVQGLGKAIPRTETSPDDARPQPS